MNVTIQNGQVKQMEEEFLTPLPSTTVDRIGFCHSISLIYIAHVAVIIRHNLRLYGLTIIVTEITLCWWTMFVKTRTSRLSLHSMAVKSSLVRT